MLQIYHHIRTKRVVPDVLALWKKKVGGASCSGVLLPLCRWAKSSELYLAAPEYGSRSASTNCIIVGYRAQLLQKRRRKSKTPIHTRGVNASIRFMDEPCCEGLQVVCGACLKAKNKDGR